MNNIDQFISTCEACIITDQSYSIVEEGVTENFKNGISWIIEKVKALWSKFKVWIASFKKKTLDKTERQIFEGKLDEMLSESGNDHLMTTVPYDHIYKEIAKAESALEDAFKKGWANSDSLVDILEKSASRIADENNYVEQHAFGKEYKSGKFGIHFDPSYKLDELKKGLEDVFATSNDELDGFAFSDKFPMLANKDNAMKLYDNFTRSINEVYQNLSNKLNKINSLLSTMITSLQKLESELKSKESSELTNAQLKAISRVMSNCSQYTNLSMVSLDKYIELAKDGQRLFAKTVLKYTHGESYNNK